MAISNDANFSYSISDDDLTLDAAQIMPSGTSSYTVSSGHTAIVVRKSSNNWTIFGATSTSNSGTIIPVSPGDVVWDVVEMMAKLKISLGGNENPNYILTIPSMDDGEFDDPVFLFLTGDISLK